MLKLLIVHVILSLCISLPEYLLSSVTNLSFTVIQNTMKSFSQRLLKCLYTSIHNSFLKDKGAFVKNHIIYVYSFNCCQGYKNIYNLEPSYEICLNPSGFEMHFFYKNIYIDFQHNPLVVILTNHINVRAASGQK